MSKTQTVCPDCSAPMQPIKLIDATEPGLGSTGCKHVELAYAAPDAQASFFLGRIPSLGIVTGMICPQCGRIALCGVPRSA